MLRVGKEYGGGERRGGGCGVCCVLRDAARGRVRGVCGAAARPSLAAY